MKKAFVILALGVAGMATFLFLQVPLFDDEWHHPAVAPRKNADGTTDYVLIQKPLKEQKGYYWVLRLPDTAYVVPSKEGEIGTVSNSVGAGVTFHSHPNKTLHMAFRIPSMEISDTKTGTDGYMQGDMMTVSARSDGPDSWEFTKQQAVKHEKSCKSLGKIAPGVIALKPIVGPKELPTIDTACDLLNGPGEPFTYYDVRDSNWNLMAAFECDSSSNHLGRSSCNGEIILPMSRGLRFNFNNDKLPPDRFLGFFYSIADFMSKATVDVGEIAPNQTFEFKK